MNKIIELGPSADFSSRLQREFEMTGRSGYDSRQTANDNVSDLSSRYFECAQYRVPKDLWLTTQTTFEKKQWMMQCFFVGSL